MEALISIRQMKDRQNVAQILKELGLLMLQQGQLNEAMQMLLRAGVVLVIIHLPDSSIVEQALEQLLTQLGEVTFHPRETWEDQGVILKFQNA